MSVQMDSIVTQIYVCNKCELGKSAYLRPVWRGTTENPDVVFIGEAPGAEEDKTGLPFVGRSGKELDKMIDYMKLEKYAITNRLHCRPPGNANPTPEQLEACYPFLLKQIELFNPALIILLGNYANDGYGPYMEFGDITEENGQFFAKLYHPAFLLYRPNFRSTQYEFMDRITKMLSDLKSKRGMRQ